MSVIIKGATMPGTCVDCPLFRESAYGFDLCKGKGIGFVAEDAKWLDATRPDWCPLVELPEKHGRLIETNSLKEQLEYYIREAGWDAKTNRVLGWVKDEFIDSEPTIVEAEG